MSDGLSIHTMVFVDGQVKYAVQQHDNHTIVLTLRGGGQEVSLFLCPESAHALAEAASQAAWLYSEQATSRIVN